MLITCYQQHQQRQGSGQTTTGRDSIAPEDLCFALLVASRKIEML
jgi:hypothetical protein